MKVEKHQQIEMADPYELYRPISEWVASLYGAAENDDDLTARYYRVLDQIVRHPEFDLDELRRVLVGGWVDFASRREDHERIEEIVWCSKAVRQFLEAKGEAKKPDANIRASGPHVH